MVVSGVPALKSVPKVLVGSRLVIVVGAGRAASPLAASEPLEADAFN